MNHDMKVFATLATLSLQILFSTGDMGFGKLLFNSRPHPLGSYQILKDGTHGIFGTIYYS